MAKAATKRIMREFKLDEISAVTVPAQKGARMVIMKRDGAPDAPLSPSMSDERLAAIVKRGKYKLTTPRNGHTHLVEIDDWALMAGGGVTSPLYTPSPVPGGREHCHSHPFVIGPKGEITIGESDGHSHEIADVPTTKASDDPPPVNPATVEKDDEAMTPEQLEKIQADIAKGNLIAGMTDAQKGHYAKLSGDEAEAFLKLDFAARDRAVAAAIAKGSEADPVEYTTKEGIAIRKSDGALALALAKSFDAAVAKIDTISQASQASEAETLAKSWGHLGMPMAEKLDLAKRIAGIADPMVKKAALDSIAMGAAAMAPLFKSYGAVDGGQAGEETPHAKLEKLAETRAAKTGETREVAYSKVLETVEGGLLYNEHRNLQNSIPHH